MLSAWCAFILVGGRYSQQVPVGLRLQSAALRTVIGSFVEPGVGHFLRWQFQLCSCPLTEILVSLTRVGYIWILVDVNKRSLMLCKSSEISRTSPNLWTWKCLEPRFRSSLELRLLYWIWNLGFSMTNDVWYLGLVQFSWERYCCFNCFHCCMFFNQKTERLSLAKSHISKN